VKYRVSLLPEQNRKRLNGKKKLEKIKLFSLVILVVLALFTFVVMFTNLYANKKLNEERKLDNEYAQKVAELEQFREINATLQKKVQLIEDIQVNEPQLVNFIAAVSNLKHPGVSITSFDCTDWKVTRSCVLGGTCDTRGQYLAFEEALKEIEGVSAVSCASYVQGVGESAAVQFTINITCTGGAAPFVTETEATSETTAADGEATDADGDATADTTVVSAE